MCLKYEFQKYHSNETEEVGRPTLHCTVQQSFQQKCACNIDLKCIVYENNKEVR